MKEDASRERQYTKIGERNSDKHRKRGLVEMMKKRRQII